jgi:hypothetical protein
MRQIPNSQRGEHMRRSVALFALTIILYSLSAHNLGAGPALVFGGQVSLRITDFSAPPRVVPGERFTANVTVEWSGFDNNARTILDNRGNTISVQPPVSYSIIVSVEGTKVTDENLKVSGSKSYGIELSAPRFAGPKNLTAQIDLRIRIQSSNNTVNLPRQDSKELTINVTPAATATTTAAVPKTTTTTQATTQAPAITTPVVTETTTQIGPVEFSGNLLFVAAAVVAILVVVGVVAFAFRRRAAKATRN